MLTKNNPHSITFPPKCIYTMAYHRIMQVERKIPTTDLPIAKSWPQLHFHLHTNWGPKITEKTVFCLGYLRHNF